MSDIEPCFMTVGEGRDKREIAFCLHEGKGPALVWFGGLASDMQGTKALALDAWAREHGQRCVRFDYSGHGRSSRQLHQGTISMWKEECLAVIDRLCPRGKMILVGSSLGAWLALLVAEELKKMGRVQDLGGLLLLAPAVNFTEELIWKQLTEGQRERLNREGGLSVSKQEGEGGKGFLFSDHFIEDGRRNLFPLHSKNLHPGCIVHILQGKMDEEVPLAHTLKLVSSLADDMVCLTVIRDGTHRLSRPEDLVVFLKIVGEMCERAGREI